MQQILRRKHREKISVGDADEDVKANSKASNLYEVCYSSVWIRREPHVEAAQVSKRIKGQQLNIEDRSLAGIPFLGLGWNVKDQNKKTRFSSQAGTIIQTKCMQVLQERLFKFGSDVYTVKTRNLHHFGVALQILQSLSLPPVLPCKEFDESGEWGRVVFKTSEGMDEGVAWLGWKVEPPDKTTETEEIGQKTKGTCREEIEGDRRSEPIEEIYRPHQCGIFQALNCFDTQVRFHIFIHLSHPHIPSNFQPDWWHPNRFDVTPGTSAVCRMDADHTSGARCLTAAGWGHVESHGNKTWKAHSFLDVWGFIMFYYVLLISLIWLTTLFCDKIYVIAETILHTFRG